MAKRFFYGWWIVVASSLIGIYVAGIVFYGFTAFFEPLVREYGWSYAQVSIASSLRGVEMGLLSPLIGFAADRFGSRKLILFGVIVVGFGLILLSLTKSLVMFYGAFLLLCLGAGGCASLVLITAVVNWFRENVGKAIGIVSCGFGLGGAMVPLIVWLIDVYDWRTALIILALGMWAIGIPLSFVIRDKPEKYGYFLDGEALPRATLNPEVQQDEVEVDFKEVLKGRTLWLISLAESIRWVIITAVIIHIMPYLSSIGMSRTNAAYVATALPLLSLIGRFGFGWIGDIFDKRYLMAVTYCLTGVGMLAFSYVEVKWLILPFLLLFSPAFGGSIPLRAAMTSSYFGRASFGKALGIVMGISSIGGIIGPALAGWAFDNMGSYHLIWLIFCGLSFVSVALILMVKPKSPSDSEN